MYFSASEGSCECSLVACDVKRSQNFGRILKIFSQKSCVRVLTIAVYQGRPWRLADPLSSDGDGMMSKSELRDLGLLFSSDGEGGLSSSEDDSSAGRRRRPQQQQLRFDSFKPPLNTSHRCLRACRAVWCVRRWWARHRRDDDDDDGGDGDETNRAR